MANSIPQHSGPDESFVRNLTGCQNRLYTYVLSLIPEPDAAREVVQNANVAIWKNTGNFKPGTDFNAWACKMAYYAVLSYRRDRGRERLVFDDDVVQSLAKSAQQRSSQVDPHALALEGCLERLPEKHRELIALRYGEEQPLAQLATKAGRTTGALGTLLYRIRQSLLDCVQGKLATGDTP